MFFSSWFFGSYFSIEESQQQEIENAKNIKKQDKLMFSKVFTGTFSSEYYIGVWRLGCF